MPNNASKFIVMLCALLKLQSWAQAPGGVSSNAVFWAKADAGLTLDGVGNVSSWLDSSFSGNDATQANTAYQPSLNPVFNNYNPALYFDGSNEHLSMNDLINPSSNTVTVFAVGTNEGGGDYWHAMVSGQTDSQWTSGGYGLASFNGQVDFGFWVNQWSNKSSSAFIGGPMMTSSILEGSYDGTNINYYRNANLNGSLPFTDAIGDGGSTNIGGGNTTANNHKGHIAEVIIYDNVPSPTDRYKINSYLALKYGITPNRFGVNDNLYNSNGASIYTGNGSNQYWHSIIGIGRDDASQLMQKQSHTTTDNLRIYLSNLATSNQLNTGSFANDNSFLVLGNDNEFVSVTIPINPEKPAGVASRLAREWKLQNTNFPDQFNIDIQLNICVDIPPINASDLRLLVADTTDFTNATIFDSTGGLNISINGNIVTLSGLSTMQFPANSIKYFTLASINTTTLDNNFHALPVADIHTCDINQNGIASFVTDLASIENQIVGAQTGLTVSYYDQAGNDLNLTDPYTNTIANQETITVRVTNSFGCYDETTFNLVIDPLPAVDTLPSETYCVSYTLPALSNNNNYYTGANGTGTLLNAGDAITNTQSLYIYADDGTCTNQTSFDITINQLPSVDLLNDVIECGSYTLPALSTNNNYYTGTDGSGTLLNAGDIITASQTLYVYANDGTCNDQTSFDITIIPIIPFSLTLDRLHISNQNDLTVIMTETGIVFEYQLDDYDFQPNNYFYDLPAGLHNLTVRDSDSCEIHSIYFYITLFEIPNQFTPNADGYNDYWKVIDSDHKIQNIVIYDRYGKMIKQLNPNSQGWDGQFNDITLPSDDYWYVILLNNQETMRGHFSLKR